MNAYEGIITKKEFVAELKKHQKADRFIKGTYWDGKRGCSVGCSLQSISKLKKLDFKDFGNHARYPELLGIPEWLARLEDTIFEGLPVKRSKKWTVEFSQAINTGADLEKVKAPMLIYILESTLEIFNHEKYPEVKAAVDGSIALWKRSDIGSNGWNKAAGAAEAAAWAAAEEAGAAEEAAWAAAKAGAAAWVAAKAGAAAGAAAGVAAEAAEAAEAAGAAAGVAAEAAEAAEAAAGAEATYEKFADKLLELLRGCE